MTSENGKLAFDSLKELKFENDFGESPIGLGHFSKDQGLIAVASLVGAFVGIAIAGLPLGAIVIVAGLNDINYTRRRVSRNDQQPKEPEIVDVDASVVEEFSAENETHLNTQEQSADRATASNTLAASSSIKWINNFISQTALIWGNQGSGKSWIVRHIAKLKKDKGYRVVVLDPDSNRAEWKGVESYHDLNEIADFLRWYVEEIKRRYKVFSNSDISEDEWRAKLWADGLAIALICEEVTTYVDLVEDKDLLTQFFRLGLTKSRKQEMPLTFVSHNNTQSALGGIKGLSNLIEKMLQLQLQTDIDPETLQPIASGKGAVKLDGSNQWVSVTLPKLERKITNFGETQPIPSQQPIEVPEQAVKTQPEQEEIAFPSPATELKVSDSLGEPLKTLWLFAKKKNSWVTVRDIYDQKMKILQGKKVEQIHQYFGLLADSGLGEIDEKGKAHSSVGFRAH